MLKFEDQHLVHDEDFQQLGSMQMWPKTWSLDSGYGRQSICHGKYCCHVTNATTERVWLEDKEPYSKSSLWEYLETKFSTIESKDREYRQKLIEQKTTNKFIPVPPIRELVWDSVKDLKDDVKL
jgi:hypothetical protein